MFCGLSQSQPLFECLSQLGALVGRTRRRPAPLGPPSFRGRAGGLPQIALVFELPLSDRADDRDHHVAHGPVERKVVGDAGDLAAVGAELVHDGEQVGGPPAGEPVELEDPKPIELAAPGQIPHSIELGAERGLTRPLFAEPELYRLAPSGRSARDGLSL